MKGILIIIWTEFCQAQFKQGLAEPSVAVDINPAGFSLGCIFKGRAKILRKNPYQLKFDLIEKGNEARTYCSQCQSRNNGDKSHRMLSFILIKWKALAELCQAQLKLGLAKQVRAVFCSPITKLLCWTWDWAWQYKDYF